MTYFNLISKQYHNRLIVSVFCFILCLILYFNIKETLYFQQTEAELTQTELLIKHLNQKSVLLKQAREQLLQKKPFLNQHLYKIVQAYISNNHLQSSQSSITALNKNKVRVAFESIRFSSLYYLLKKMWQGNFITVSEMNIMSIDPGLVQANLVLKIQPYTPSTRSHISSNK